MRVTDSPIAKAGARPTVRGGREAADQGAGRRRRSRRRIPVLILTAAISAATAAPASAGQCPDANTLPRDLTVERARAAVSCLINRHRSYAGVRAALYNEKLTRTARKHSVSMDKGNYFSHFGPGSSTPLSRIRASGYLAGAYPWGIGENIAYGKASVGTPAHAVLLWLQSPPHRATLLGGRYRHVGVGVALGSPVGGGKNSAIYTLDFGYRK